MDLRTNILFRTGKLRFKKNQAEKKKEKKQCREFSGGPVVRALHFHCRGHGFNPWSGN